MTASETTVREIPLNKLKPSPANVRRTATDAGIEELAASIAAHGLLQMPVVQPERTGEGEETGCYLVTAGERRRKALLLLVTQKKLKKTAPIACLVKTDGNPAEISLAENTVRVPMHRISEPPAGRASTADTPAKFWVESGSTDVMR